MIYHDHDLLCDLLCDCKWDINDVTFWGSPGKTHVLGLLGFGSVTPGHSSQTPAGRQMLHSTQLSVENRGSTGKQMTTTHGSCEETWRVFAFNVWDTNYKHLQTVRYTQHPFSTHVVQVMDPWHILVCPGSIW